MPELSNAELLKKWFRDCPAISSANRFGIDHLSEKPTEYAILSTPSTIAYRENVLGEEVPREIQTLNFIFATKEFYGKDPSQNAANLAFFDAVIMWIWEQNEKRNYPKIVGGTVKSIVPTLTAYPAEVGSAAAKYQIQLKLTYKLSEEE